MIITAGGCRRAGERRDRARVERVQEVTQAASRLDAEGLDTEPEPGAVCCYARQDKVWAHDPDDLAWECYTVLEHIEIS